LIASYRDQRTRDFAGGRRVKAFAGIERSARLKLDRLEAALALKDPAILPGNRFEALATARANTASVSMTGGGSVLSGRATRWDHQRWRLSTTIRRMLWR
jgi:proteic killer suppression protein